MSEKAGLPLVVFRQNRHLQPIFCVRDCRSRNVQVEYQGHTRNTRILEGKRLINTSYRIRHRLELKYFHLAQFLLNTHLSGHQPRKSEN